MFSISSAVEQNNGRADFERDSWILQAKIAALDSCTFSPFTLCEALVSRLSCKPSFQILALPSIVHNVLAVPCSYAYSVLLAKNGGPLSIYWIQFICVHFRLIMLVFLHYSVGDEGLNLLSHIFYFAHAFYYNTASRRVQYSLVKEKCDCEQFSAFVSRNLCWLFQNS